MNSYSFDESRKSWTNIPLDRNARYANSEELLLLGTRALRKLVKECQEERYDVNKNRNYGNKWRELMGLDTTSGKTILDFGCGLGLESLEFAKRGNKIILADINPSNVQLANRVLELSGYTALEQCPVTGEWPYCTPSHKVDIFYANGVLHHIPYAKDLIKRAVEIVGSKGEIRLMLYSDKAWERFAGGNLPAFDDDPRKQEGYISFLASFDRSSTYTNWYNEAKIRHNLGDLVKVITCEYFGKDNDLLAVSLKKI